MLKGAKLMGLRQLGGWETSARPVIFVPIKGLPAFDNQRIKASNHPKLTAGFILGFGKMYIRLSRDSGDLKVRALRTVQKSLG
jgi:hypothetical protein